MPGEQRYRLRLKASAVADLGRLDRAVAVRIRRAIRTKLLSDPRRGKPLRSALDADTERSLWSLRVGDYRVIYVFSDAEVWVLVVRVGHRARIYHDL